jgi:hypothetical protein
MVDTYDEQKRKHPHWTPRGICQDCKQNIALKKDNFMWKHNTPGTSDVCPGSFKPSAGLPGGQYKYY